MKITAGGKTKQKITGTVYIVYGSTDGEGNEPLAVCTSRKLANLAIQTDMALRKLGDRFPFDSYFTEKFRLDTAEYRTPNFGTVTRSL
jgi:hypothetical protein